VIDGSPGIVLFDDKGKIRASFDMAFGNPSLILK